MEWIIWVISPRCKWLKVNRFGRKAPGTGRTVDYRNENQALDLIRTLVFFPAFTFIKIYLMLNLPLGHKFLFLLRYLFLLCNLLFWFRKNLLLFSRIISLIVAGRARMWVNLYMSSVDSAPSFVHLNVLSDRELTSKPLSSPSLWIFKHVQQKFSTLFGPLTLCPAPLFG